MTNVRQNCEIGSKHKTNVEKIVLVVNWQLKEIKKIQDSWWCMKMCVPQVFCN